jgi:hypothetical protein
MYHPRRQSGRPPIRVTFFTYTHPAPGQKTLGGESCARRKETVRNR